MTKEGKDKQDRMIELLEEILKWTKFEGRKRVTEVFKSELDDETKKLVYELSDGRSSPEIARIVKVDSSTVRDWWRKWADTSIMEICQGYKRRYCKTLSLGELGIEAPEFEPTALEEKKEEKNEQQN